MMEDDAELTLSKVEEEMTVGIPIEVSPGDRPICIYCTRHFLKYVYLKINPLIKEEPDDCEEENVMDLEALKSRTNQSVSCCCCNVMLIAGYEQ